MPYREVTMHEVKEVLRLWLMGHGKKPIARQLGLDRNTVRSYISHAERAGLNRAGGEAALTDELITQVLLRLRAPRTHEHGSGWAVCVEHRDFLKQKLDQGVLLTKTLKLLAREREVAIPYSTAHRFAVAEFNFGRKAPTMPVADCAPGAEIQVDTGWVAQLEPDLFGKRRRIKAWIFTAVLSRHRFVWPILQETTKSAIEACEAAWEFFGGVFHVLIVDNTKAIVTTADHLEPRLARAFLEYAQSRGFVIDPARVRSPKDKARVERAVQTVRNDCFGGERLYDLDQCRERARRWSLEDYGRRRHTRTQRCPLEHFLAEEKAALRPPPTERYDVPLWCEPKVGLDQHAQVAKALYSLPRRFLRKRLTARADSQLVRFYDGTALVKTHPRKPPGGRSSDPSDFPPEQDACARRDMEFFLKQAVEHGTAIGHYAEALLAGPQPWSRVRRVYALLALVKRYGAARVEPCCVTALAADLSDMRRFQRIVELAVKPPVAPIAAPKPPPPARYLRDPGQYALPNLTNGERHECEPDIHRPEDRPASPEALQDAGHPPGTHHARSPGEDGAPGFPPAGALR
jgi:hypothetical protein